MCLSVVHLERIIVRSFIFHSNPWTAISRLMRRVCPFEKYPIEVHISIKWIITESNIITSQNMTPTVCSWTGWTGDYLIMVKISSVIKWALCNNLLIEQIVQHCQIMHCNIADISVLITSRSTQVNLTLIRIAIALFSFLFKAFKYQAVP